jgi:hypothetical protein
MAGKKKRIGFMWQACQRPNKTVTAGISFFEKAPNINVLWRCVAQLTYRYRLLAI